MAGDIALTSLKFKDKIKGAEVKDLKLKVVPAEIDPSVCVAELDKLTINAGESYIYSIYLKDKFLNRITLTDANMADEFKKMTIT